MAYLITKPLKYQALILILLLLTLLGCSQPKVGIVESMISITTGAATGGIDAPIPSACVWLIGRYGPARGLSMVLAHGDMTVERCMAFGVPAHVTEPPPSP